jgi:hypothetical protein
VFGLSLAKFLSKRNEECDRELVGIHRVLEYRKKEAFYNEMKKMGEDLYAVYKYRKSSNEVHQLILFYQNLKTETDKKSVLYYSVLVVLSLLHDYCVRYNYTTIPVIKANSACL